MDTRPAILPYRWRTGVDVCMVIRNRQIRFVARDVLEVLGLEVHGELARDPSHQPSLTAHAEAISWDREQIGQMLGEGTEHISGEFKVFLNRLDMIIRSVDDDRVDALERAANRGPTAPVDIEPEEQAVPPEWYSVDDAARLLSTDPGIGRLTRTNLFDQLSRRGWIYRERDTWLPHSDLTQMGFLLTRHVRIPADRHLYPQICITPLGLIKLHKFLGGSHPLNLTPTGAPA